MALAACRRRRFTVLGTLALALVPAAASLAGDGDAAATTVFVNAHVFTAEPSALYAQAVAVRGERILAVGERGAVVAAAGSAARLVDLHGGFLMPGLIDAHAHPIGSRLVLGGGYGLVMANFPDAGGPLSGLLQFVARTVDQNTSRFGDTVIVNGVDIGYWSQAQDIDAALSAGRFAALPIVLLGNDGHTAWANAPARARAGITAEFLRGLAPQDRAHYGCSAAFEPNGFVVDAGLTRLHQSLPAPAPDLALAAGRAGVRAMNALGITAWLDAAVAGVVGGDLPLTLDDPGALPVYRELSRRGELTAHVAALPVIDPAGGVQQIDVMQALQRQYRDVANLTLPGIKIFADGVVEFPSQTAALTRPYRNTGRLVPSNLAPERFAQLVTEADRRGLIVHVHAIGDQAVKAALDAFGAARAENPQGRLPHSLTHAQFVDPEDWPRFAQYRVIAVLQLLWALADPSTNEVVRPYIDPTIYPLMYPARSLLESGATIAGASDWPVSSADPFEAMAQAQTRIGPQGVLDAAQRMPREAMLLAYTRNAAQVLDQLDTIGSLAPGKRADLVLVDRDVLSVPAEDLRQAKVLWTMFGGTLVYEAPAAR